MKTINRVKPIIDGVITREGGFTDNPKDKGGKTRFGITEMVARAEGYQGDMRELPRALAFQIYLEVYWIGPGFARLEPIFPKVAEELLDAGVNMGPAVPARFLQRALNGFNREGGDYPDIAVDSRIGPRTAGAALAFKQRRGAKAEPALLELLRGLRAARYLDLCEGRPANEEFLFGWIDRLIVIEETGA